MEPLIRALVTPPLPAEIDCAYTPIYGYYVAYVELPIVITINGREIQFEVTDRDDLHKLFPDRICQGFYAVYKVAPEDAYLELVVRIGDAEINRHTAPITNGARLSVETSSVSQAINRAFVLTHLICVNCGGSLASEEQPVFCPTCGIQFDCSTRAVSAVPAGSYRIPTATNTSFCAYGAEETTLIADARSAGGVILDFGAGLRPHTERAVVSVEIADMPSIDLVAIGDRIPFADDTFDGAITLHVLEHVKQPWNVAKELIRVVKPGAPILSTVPYVCSVHGFPNHFFNMTPQGLRLLFEDAEFVSHTIKPDGHPINGIKQLLSTYWGSILDPAVRQRFGELTVRDIVDKSLGDILQLDWAQTYPELARWEMPAHSTLVVRKPLKKRISPGGRDKAGAEV
jgi:SAM-dependent methyltransferase